MTSISGSSPGEWAINCNPIQQATLLAMQEQPRTVEELAQRTGNTPLDTVIAVRELESRDLAEKHERGRWHLTPDGEKALRILSGSSCLAAVLPPDGGSTDEVSISADPAPAD